MERFKVAVLVNRQMAQSIFEKKDIEFLNTFAVTNDLSLLPEKMTREYMTDAAREANACITCWGTPSFTDEMLSDMPKLRLVAHAAGSVKSLFPEAFWNGKRRITSNAPIIAADVAQTTLAHMLYCLKFIPCFSAATKKGEWTGGEVSHFMTKNLNGLDVGLLGASNVGREVIKILKPFRCNIKVYDPFLSPMEAEELEVKAVGLEEVLSTCEVVSLHMPANDDCRYVINVRTAPLLKDGCLFINTARGMLVDEKALIKELETGRITACIDVTDPEPPAADHPFRQLSNVILTPHMAGGATRNCRLQLGKTSIREVYTYLTRGYLRNEVREEMLSHMA